MSILNIKNEKMLRLRWNNIWVCKNEFEMSVVEQKNVLIHYHPCYCQMFFVFLYPTLTGESLNDSFCKALLSDGEGEPYRKP